MQTPQVKKRRPKIDKGLILSTVAHECGFRFFTSTGDYTGVTSHSIEEFAAHLKIITIGSIEFHFGRTDFQKWVGDILCDTELAERIGLIGAGFSGENLRKQLVKIVETRLTELRRP